MQKVLCIELCATFVMVIMLYFLAINTLWDDTYVQMIEEDAKTSPFIDIKMVEGKEDCPSGYPEKIAKAYWWGLK